MDMITYANKSIRGNYIELPEELPDDQYRTGTTINDYMAGWWIALTDEQLAFRAANPTANVIEVLTLTAPAPIDTPLAVAIREKLIEIDNYDASPEVNNFTFSGAAMWLTPAERANYARYVAAKESASIDTVCVPLAGQTAALPTVQAQQILSALELYAGDCYLVTEQHRAAVRALSTPEAVAAYDFRAGYPPKLNF